MNIKEIERKFGIKLKRVAENKWVDKNDDSIRLQTKPNAVKLGFTAITLIQIDKEKVKREKDNKLAQAVLKHLSKNLSVKLAILEETDEYTLYQCNIKDVL